MKIVKNQNWCLLIFSILADGQRLPHNHRHRVHENGTLEVQQVESKEDEGMYTCTALNKIKQSSSSSLHILAKGKRKKKWCKPFVCRWIFGNNLTLSFLYKKERKRKMMMCARWRVKISSSRTFYYYMSCAWWAVFM